MGQLLPLPQSRRRVSNVRIQSDAKVIIFPGVRVQYHDEKSEAEPAAAPPALPRPEEVGRSL